MRALKVDLSFAIGGIKNHEIYFEHLGGDGGEPDGLARDLIERDFGSVADWRADLKATGMAGRGWAWTAYDWDEGRLFNYIGDAQNTFPIWNATPLVALDVYEHAYFLDYQTDRASYIDAFFANLDWDVVNDWVRSTRSRPEHTSVRPRRLPGREHSDRLLAGARCCGARTSARSAAGTSARRTSGAPTARATACPVMLADTLKGFVPALLATIYVGHLAGVLAGGAAMLGHWRPLFMGFAKGGKAVATCGGAFLAVAPVVGGIGLVVWLVTFALFRYASVASIIAALSLPVVAVLLDEPWPVIAFAALAALAVIVLHRPNISRLRAGTETRFRFRRLQRLR